MKPVRLPLLLLAGCIVCAASLHAGRAAAGGSAAESLGIFAGRGDVGAVLHAGSVVYDAAKRTYTVSGSGENMWLGKDEFQFAWKKMSGDVALTADIHFLGTGGNPHRKAVLMIRQNLDTDSIYADVALHGVGLTSLQYRDAKGADTNEVQANISVPQRLRIEKHGDSFSMWLGDAKGAPKFAGGSVRVPIGGDFYVGIGVCAHDKDRVETAVFSNVRIEPLKAAPVAAENSEAGMTFYSSLEEVSVSSGDRRAVYATEGRIEAPNWTHDGKTLLFNRNGRIEKISAEGGTPETLDTGFATQCNNDHGISPDGTQLAMKMTRLRCHRFRSNEERLG